MNDSTALSASLIKNSSALVRVSIVLPILHHHGHALEAVESWVSGQTYPRELMQLVVVSDGLIPELDKQIQKILGKEDCLIIERYSSYFQQLNVGARHARGEILFFTESHAAGLPNCIEELVRFMSEVKCAGASGGMVGGTDVFFETIIDELFIEDDDKYLVASKSWRKMALRAFALRSEVFREYGPFDEEFALFSERAFPIKLCKQGVVLEYAPNVIVKHFNAPDLQVLEHMVHSFVGGECQYRFQFSSEHCEEYLEYSSFWSRRTEYRCEISASRLKSLLSHLRRCMTSPRERLYAISRLPELADYALMHKFGFGWLMTKMRLRMLALETRIKLYLLWKSARCQKLVREYWYELLTPYAWLRTFKERPETLDVPKPNQGKNIELSACDETIASGFFASECFCGKGFRWSQPEAAVRVAVPSGNYSVEVELIPGIVDPAKLKISACFDGNELAPPVERSNSVLQFRLNETDFSSGSEHIFSFACRPSVFPGDSRRLGMPVHAIKFENITTESVDAADNARMALNALTELVAR